MRIGKTKIFKATTMPLTQRKKPRVPTKGAYYRLL